MSAEDNDEDILKGVSNIDGKSQDALEQEEHKIEESQDNTAERQGINGFVSQDENQQNRDGKKGIIEKASEVIMNRRRLLTIEETKEIRYYRNGVYVPGGDILIEKEAEAIYGYDLANHHLSEIKGHIMRKTYHQRSEIDANINIVNVKNGLYNIQTGKIRPHSPYYLSINQVPIVYNPKARPKLFGQFLFQVLYAPEIRTAVELMAYTFFRDNPFEACSQDC